MTPDADFDVVIVGAGIAGASVGWRLAPHARVALIEGETQPGFHSTGRSAAMFMESYGPPAVRALTRASRAFYEHPPAGFAATPLLAPRGAMYVAGRGQLALLGATRTALATSCPGLRELTRDEALSRVPCLRPEAVAAALLDDDALDIDVHAVHQGFLRGFKAQGGQLRCNAGLQRAVRTGDHWDLRLGDGTALRCRILVDAAGAWADAVAASWAVAPIGLEPRRRTAFTFRPPAGVDASRWPCVADIDERWYFKPDAGQLLGSPANADPVPAHDVQAEELDVATGIARIEAATTLQIRRPTGSWAGLRSFVRDGEPVIGWDAGCPGFFWLAGQGGYGIQTAAAASALAAALLLGSPVPGALGIQGVDPDLLSPVRLRTG